MSIESYAFVEECNGIYHFEDISDEYIHSDEECDVPLRGTIREFSYKSRRNLLNFLERVSPEYTIYSVTLTLPSDYPTDIRSVKKDLDLLLRRIELPSVWKMEFTKKQQLHFHILLYSLSPSVDYYLIKEYFNERWPLLVSSGYLDLYERMKKCSTRVERVEDKDVHEKYVAKGVNYLTKDDYQNLPYDHLGRFWGVYHRSLFIFSDSFTYVITFTDFRKFQDYYIARHDLLMKLDRYYNIRPKRFKLYTLPNNLLSIIKKL